MTEGKIPLRRDFLLREGQHFIDASAFPYKKVKNRAFGF